MHYGFVFCANNLLFAPFAMRVTIGVMRILSRSKYRSFCAHIWHNFFDSKLDQKVTGKW
jgi:hypothetical protein